MQHNSFIVSKPACYCAIVAVFMFIFGYYRLTFTGFTSDELLFTGGFFNTYEGDANYQYYIATWILKGLYDIGLYSSLILNITLTLFWLYYLFRFSSENKTFSSSYFWLLLFLLPSNLFFASAFLRDYYAFLISIVFLCFLIGKGGRAKFFCILALMFMFRTEAALVLLFATFLSKFKNPLYYFFPLGILIIFFALNYTSFYDFFSYRSLALQDDSLGFGIFQFNKTPLNAFYSTLINWPMYYMPMLVADVETFGEWLFLFDSILGALLLLMAVVFFSRATFRSERAYRVCIYILLLSFLVAMVESSPLTMMRHKVAYMPFLFYLAFRNFNYKFKF
ncbi:hypothetical protein [Marinomonas sp. PE14-40]|uniref:hypothetical protein n=1 Tax=Marinomonas sp. PE14-40 TaxID=3060621 RepID=UPI003F66BF67